MPVKEIGGIAYILSPVLGFIPQIYTGKIIFSPMLSLLTIISCIIKFFHYYEARYSVVLLYQFLFIILLHGYLIRNYRLPLRRIELVLFRPELYSKHGLGMYCLSVATIVAVLANVFFILGFGPVFGIVASTLDLMITFIQLLIYKNAIEKPLELFACWVVGDLIKLATMIFIYKAPLIYNISIVAQILLNLHVFIL
ncbi:hypothetical protein PAEPH01_0169 [Pancytospora epiphaga]|nr:hypothetical protein PAEPH01_0169 [Pancytospora epiphaga]